MIKVENIRTDGWESAIRGMRNPMNSWERSDSYIGLNCDDDHVMIVGPNDLDLMMRLAKAGPVHAKYRRFITITMDITAPLYWWKEFDTYKIGTVANSCSTMHKIHAKEFTLEDFSCEHLLDEQIVSSNASGETTQCYPLTRLRCTISDLNVCREKFLQTNDKCYWWQMIQLLPTSYNQKRTVLLNYEVASHMYFDREDHKLDEWRELCGVFETLPYSQLITLEAA